MSVFLVINSLNVEISTLSELMTKKYIFFSILSKKDMREDRCMLCDFYRGWSLWYGL